MRHAWLSMFALAVFVTTLTACDKKPSDTASETADVTVNGAAVEIKSESGSLSVGEGTKLPEEWPADVPVYTGAKLMSVAMSKEVSSLQATTPDSREEVAEFYKEQLTKDDWTEKSVMTQPFVMLTYTKDTRNVGVMISLENSQTSVTITITNN